MTHVDSERQDRGVKLMLALLGAAVIVVVVYGYAFMLLVNKVVVIGNTVTAATGRPAVYGQVPMIILVGAMFGSIVSAVGLRVERKTGLLSRFWTLPIHRAAGLVGRMMAEAVRVLATTIVILVVGIFLGFRLTQGLLPSLFLLIIGARFFGKGMPDMHIFGREMTASVLVIILIIGLTSWMYLARIVRANILSLRERDYISAATALGASDFRLILNHLLPNTTAPLVVAATLGVAAAILSEAYVSFLGVGVQGATATWGNMLEGAYNYIESAYWLWLFPGMLIALVVLGLVAGGVAL